MFSGWNERQKILMIYFGNMTAAVYNTIPSSEPRRAFTWRDIYGGSGEKDEDKQMTNHEINVRLHSLFGGTHVR